ncbi:hypothetical protein AAFF_G00405920 [Aldrovandia affinis]|uniref:Uncharacterized protein n=1 Tax=Aldrovandia affinis TaxID=143900 RepID=A0AAD7SCL7_9TELE|nr:hypothetical protein AAFF_G00405920 [Aldrovandia affinis]
MVRGPCQREAAAESCVGSGGQGFGLGPRGRRFPQWPPCWCVPVSALLPSFFHSDWWRKKPTACLHVSDMSHAGETASRRARLALSTSLTAPDKRKARYQESGAEGA